METQQFQESLGNVSRHQKMSIFALLRRETKDIDYFSNKENVGEHW